MVTRKLRGTVVDTLDQFLDDETRRQLDQTLEQWYVSSQRDERKPALLHCDIGPGHMLSDPQMGELTGVIDFADLAIGDPARDFIYIYEDYGPAILKEILHHYAGNDTPEMMSAIRKWYILEAIAWTVQKFVVGRSSDIKHGLGEISHELAAWIREH